MSENGEIYTAGKDFTLPAVTNSTSGAVPSFPQIALCALEMQSDPSPFEKFEKNFTGYI